MASPFHSFVTNLGDIAAESGRISKGAFVRWAMQLLSVTVQRGNYSLPSGCSRGIAEFEVRLGVDSMRVRAFTIHYVSYAS